MTRGKQWCFCVLGALCACGVAAGTTHTGAQGDEDCGAANASPVLTESPYTTVASGTLVGPGVSASFCDVGTYLSESAAPPYTYELDFNSGALSPFPQQSPAGASNPYLQGVLLVTAPSPGVYSSTDAGSCSFIDFSYLPAGVDCGDNIVGPDCPQGCASDCDTTGDCTPCVTRGANYYASSSSECGMDGGTNVPAGSWTLTLTSVVPTSQVPVDYTPHGTLTATLPNTQGGTGTVTLTMQF